MSDNVLTMTDPDGNVTATVGMSAPLPPVPPPPADTAPSKRPTTRAGRAAASAANKAKAGGKPKADSKPKATSTPRKAQLETRLTGSLTTLGTGIAMAGGMVSPAFQADGVLIVQHAESVAQALNKVAQDQPHVKAALERMLTAGVYSSLIAALLPLAIGIAANHGAIPPGIAAMLAGAQVPDESQPEAGGVTGIV